LIDNRVDEKDAKDLDFILLIPK